MKFTHLLMALSATGMAAAPALAAPVANPATSLSIAPVRAGTTTSHKSQLAGGAGIFIALLAAAAIAAGAVAAATHHSHPDSP